MVPMLSITERFHRNSKVNHGNSMFVSMKLGTVPTFCLENVFAVQVRADHCRLNEEHKNLCVVLSGVVSEILPPHRNATQSDKAPISTAIASRE